MLRQRRAPNSEPLLPHHQSYSSDGSLISSRPRQRKRALQRIAVLGVTCLSVFILAGTGVIKLSSPFRSSGHASHQQLAHAHHLHDPHHREDQELKAPNRIGKKERPLDERRGQSLQKEEARGELMKEEELSPLKQPQVKAQQEPISTKPQEPPPTKPQDQQKPPPTKPQEPPTAKPQEQQKPPPTKPQEPPPTKPQEQQTPPPASKPQDHPSTEKPHNQPLLSTVKEAHEVSSSTAKKTQDEVAHHIPGNLTFAGNSTTHVICPDGSTGILNDNYCDCSDGSDETRTSACSHLLVHRAIFLCSDGSQSIFASRVGDGIVDCPDGSDEQKTIENGNIRLANVMQQSS